MRQNRKCSKVPTEESEAAGRPMTPPRPYDWDWIGMLLYLLMLVAVGVGFGVWGLG